VNERRNDTTEPSAESRPSPGRYYYDDATGYEVFDPAGGDVEDDAEEDDAEGGPESEAPRARAAGPGAPARTLNASRS
jgi:hypothetical protein